MTDNAPAQEIEYRVSWAIDVIASSPEEAARKARAIQLRTESIADVFTVESVSGREEIDLSGIDGRDID